MPYEYQIIITVNVNQTEPRILCLLSNYKTVINK